MGWWPRALVLVLESVCLSAARVVEFEYYTQAVVITKTEVAEPASSETRCRSIAFECNALQRGEDDLPLLLALAETALDLRRRHVAPFGLTGMIPVSWGLFRFWSQEVF